MRSKGKSDGIIERRGLRGAAVGAKLTSYHRENSVMLEAGSVWMAGDAKFVRITQRVAR